MKAAFYKGTHTGMPGIYNRLVRWWTAGAYSHCELVFSDGTAASSSFMDGGVRFKQIDFNADKWDFVDLPPDMEPSARAWFEQHQGQPYSLRGNLHFVLGAVVPDQSAWFCSESLAAALGFPDPWRYDPNSLASTLAIFKHPATAGFFSS